VISTTEIYYPARAVLAWAKVLQRMRMRRRVPRSRARIPFFSPVILLLHTRLVGFLAALLAEALNMLLQLHAVLGIACVAAHACRLPTSTWEGTPAIRAVMVSPAAVNIHVVQRSTLNLINLSWRSFLAVAWGAGPPTDHVGWIVMIVSANRRTSYRSVFP